MATNDKSIFKSLAGPLAAGVLIAVCAFTMCASDAMAQRGGGRGGGGGSRGGGGGGHGGRMAQSSVSGGNRGGGSRSSAGGGRSGSSYGGGGGQRSGSGSSARNGGGDRGGSDRSGGGDRTRNGGDRTRTSGDRTTNIGSNNNVNIDRGDVNIDVEGGCCGGGGWGYRHPVAAGITIGAIAGSVAAATYGSYYYALPPSGCVTVVRAGANYYQCGSAYYQEAMDGDTVVYMSVQP